MSGTKAGAAKARETNKQRHGADFYKKIGKKSWQDPSRSHETGFALMPPEKRQELGRKGGSKTKEQYATNTETATSPEIEETGTGSS